MAIMHYRTRGGRVSPWQELNVLHVRMPKAAEAKGRKIQIGA
ncbi:MAG: hypothetical protein WEA09_04565 [Gemmatimonadota bacterium]